MRKTISSGRVAAMAALVALFVVIYLVFLYKLQIIEGEKYYNQSNEITSEERTVTAARGNILDRYSAVRVDVAMNGVKFVRGGVHGKFPERYDIADRDAAVAVYVAA